MRLLNGSKETVKLDAIDLELDNRHTSLINLIDVRNTSCGFKRLWESCEEVLSADVGFLENEYCIYVSLCEVHIEEV